MMDFIKRQCRLTDMERYPYCGYTKFRQNFTVQARNQLDHACREHDMAYALAMARYRTDQAQTDQADQTHADQARAVRHADQTLEIQARVIQGGDRHTGPAFQVRAAMRIKMTLEDWGIIGFDLFLK